jgi:Rrf2 family nitric oxide-sensitive transcriptional repressor
MQLTQFSDYSLRLLLYVGAHRERVVPLTEVSDAYGISHHHLVKVARRLIETGFLVSTRGRSGGLRLNHEPAEINIGRVIRLTEPHFHLVECFDKKANTCPITSVCGLKGALNSALDAYLRALDRYSLADFLPAREPLLKVWRKGAARSAAQ